MMTEYIFIMATALPPGQPLLRRIHPRTLGLVTMVITSLYIQLYTV